MTIVLRYLRRHLATLTAATVLLGLSGVLTTRVLAYTNALAANGLHDARATLARAGAYYATLLACSLVANVVLARVGADLVVQLRIELSQRFLELEYAKSANRSHTIFSAIIQDLGRIGPLVLLGPQLAYNLLLVTLFSSYLVTVAPSLFASFVAMIGTAFFAAARLERSTRREFDEMRAADEAFYEHVRAIGHSKKELTLSRARAEHYLDKLIRPSATKAGAIMSSLHFKWAIGETASTIVLNGSIFGVVFLGYVAFGLSAATITQFVLGSIFLLGPLLALIANVQAVGHGLASIRHLERIGLDLGADLPSRGLTRARASEGPSAWERLDARDLSYRYDVAGEAPRAFGVGPIDLTIRRGEIVFIVGANGSGKSTLLYMLCGLLSPTSGELRIDGRPVHEDIERHRAKFCGTFNDCFVFRDVLDGSGESKSDADVQALLSKYGLDRQIDVSNGKLSRLEVSTGQKKRLALIQTLAQDADIFFFDEWPAEQDPAFRELFYCTLLPELRARGKTLLVVSHDDHYFHTADRIFRIDNGVISSDGPPPSTSRRPLRRSFVSESRSAYADGESTA